MRTEKKNGEIRKKNENKLATKKWEKWNEEMANKTAREIEIETMRMAK